MYNELGRAGHGALEMSLYLIVMLGVILVATAVAVPSLFRKKCPKCGARNGLDAPACARCGAPFADCDL